MAEHEPSIGRKNMSDRPYEADEEGVRWRHKKRGTTYEVLTHRAFLQCSAAPEFEDMFCGDFWTVYRSVATGAVYVRPTEEFMDGRFEMLTTPQETKP